MIIINKADLKDTVGKIYFVDLSEFILSVEVIRKVTNEFDEDLMFAHNIQENLLAVTEYKKDFTILKIHTDMTEENQEQLDSWNPEEAKKLGTLKGMAEFKTDLNHETPKIEFSEPKAKKKIQTTAKVVDVKKSRNKNSLF